MTRDLLRRERQGERLAVEVGPFSAYILVVAAQLAARKAGSSEEAAMFRTAAAELDLVLAGSAAGDMLTAGWRQIDLGTG